jgi:hypothetical protein
MRTIVPRTHSWDDARQVARHIVGNRWYVSTIDREVVYAQANEVSKLFIDFRDGFHYGTTPELQFETMVFPWYADIEERGDDVWCQRCATREMAVRMHERICEQIALGQLPLAPYDERMKEGRQTVEE